MREAIKISVAFVATVYLMLAPVRADAAFSDIFGRAADLYKGMSIGAHTSDGEQDEIPEEDAGEGDEPIDDGEDEPEDESDDTDTPSGGTMGLPGLCQVPQEPAKIECEIGSGFLCVSTPDGGVADSSFLLRGTIDRQSSVVASITIAAQNEYTKRLSLVDTSAPATTGCWDEGADGSPFCLDADGRFQAVVELPEMGPYTVSVTASRIVGDSVERKVRISRVVAPGLSPEDVQFDPDMKSGGSTDASHVRISVDLLGGCQFCDFIGASTGGVSVTVENRITGEDGQVRYVSCVTTVEQGGQGRFAVGAPVGVGDNSVTVRACNAASEGNCPSFGPISFQGTGPGETVEGITFLSPVPYPSYDSDEYPDIPWRFRIAGEEECVDVRFNRLAPISLCPDSQGVYSLILEPRRGINVVSIAGESGMEEFAWTFGWGKIMSPHAGTGGVMEVPSAVELALPARTAREILLPIINNFLASDERDEFISDVLDDIGGGDSQAAGSDDISIPKCGSSDLGGFTAELRGTPALGEALIEDLAFSGNRMSLSASVKDVEIGMDLVPDKDLPPLPLVISFRKALLDLELTSDVGSGGLPVIILGSPHDDCDYKSGSYCKHIPAALIPKNLVGGANSWGGFVKCDMDIASGKAKEACSAINSLNAQTGLINEKVLDAINGALYCGGSEALTRLAREGVQLPPLSIGDSRGSGGIIPYITIPLGLSLDDGIGISGSGILVDATIEVGSASTYAATPEEARIPSAGVIKGKGFGGSSFASASDADGDLGVSLSLDAVDALLFAATAQGDGMQVRGALDIDIHEKFVGEQDFDFVSECDAFESTEDEEDKPTLCHIRPRVSELLGTALTTYGYFPGNHPLMIAVRANRALGPRIAAADLSDVPVVAKGGDVDEGVGSYVPSGSIVSVELGGVTLAFYALAVDESVMPDEYGNPTALLDEEGDPVISSMNPGDSDPWNGQIISFDLTLLAAVEIGRIELDPEDETQFAIPLRILTDRTRLVLTPIPSTNSTTVPALSLVSQLVEKLGLAISGFSGEEEAITIPVPRVIELAADDEGLMGALGLREIEFGEEGLSFEVEPDTNSVTAAISAIITQVLHMGGQSKEYTVPD